MTPTDRQRHSAELLNNPVFREIAQDMDRSFYEQWQGSEDAEDREELWRQIRSVRLVLGTIKIMAQPAAKPEEVA